MNAPATPDRTTRFWIGQFLPPLVILLLLWRDDGATFGFIAAMLLPVAVVSLASLLWRLFRRREPARMLRPALALLLVVGAVVYAKHSLQQAHVIVDAEARRLQALCSSGSCPDSASFPMPAVGTFARAPSPPTHLHWPVIHRRVDTGFELELLHGPDFRTRWTGGPDRAVEVFDVADHVAVPRSTPSPGDAP